MDNNTLTEKIVSAIVEAKKILENIQDFQQKTLLQIDLNEKGCILVSVSGTYQDQDENWWGKNINVIIGRISSIPVDKNFDYYKKEVEELNLDYSKFNS